MFSTANSQAGPRAAPGAFYLVQRGSQSWGFPSKPCQELSQGIPLPKLGCLQLWSVQEHPHVMGQTSDSPWDTSLHPHSNPVYWNILYFKRLFKFFLNNLLQFLILPVQRDVPMQMSCYTTQLRPAEVTSGALGWERRRKNETKLCLVKGAEVIYPLLWIFWASWFHLSGYQEHHQPPNEWFKKECIFKI